MCGAADAQSVGAFCNGTVTGLQGWYFFIIKLVRAVFIFLLYIIIICSFCDKVRACGYNTYYIGIGEREREFREREFSETCFCFDPTERLACCRPYIYADWDENFRKAIHRIR